jgi:hypothetical protein
MYFRAVVKFCMTGRVEANTVCRGVLYYQQNDGVMSHMNKTGIYRY